MRLTTLTARRIASAALAVLAAVGLSMPAASAANLVSQLPGASAEGTIVVTDSPRVTVTVGPNTAEDQNVTVTVKNNYDSSFRCAAPGAIKDAAKKPAEVPNVLTTADIVSKSVAYYRSKPFVPKDNLTVPFIGALPIGEFLQFVPEGLIGRLLGEDINSRAELFRNWEKARLAGQAAEITPFTLAPDETKEITVPLDAPASGPRTDFQAAALLYCVDTTSNPQQAYVFAGYEKTEPPKAPQGSQGSLGALTPREPAGNGQPQNPFGSLGSLGSLSSLGSS
ncbi:hypothetical protein F7230_05285 [Corynebacterium sp. 320]|uniref:hypothetical protein n=1 Tax=Corynebacterium TaxID=1716 RepID=UPI00125CAC9C|nr:MULTISPECIES: hypothetical protein [Corynebacterium]KAB1504475.1 hypothetical protein F7230_05285 [Corynebacterium sp. 320]KAB3528611.1 hypothetical protein F8354_05285 [Corynebacterium sp. 250]QNP92156.1 hypothetical protein IAU67_09175 [Corynebacterium zhongnanshanii]